MDAPTSPRILRRVGARAALAAGLLLAPVLSGCSDDGSDGTATVATTEADGPAPGSASAELALEEGRTAIDVRAPDEYAAGHVDDATLVDFQADDFADRIAALDPDDAYVVYCRTGNRSAQAAQEMRAIGLDVLDGGALTDMEAAGWPVTS